MAAAIAACCGSSTRYGGNAAGYGTAKNYGGSPDPPPLKWSDLRYVSDIEEDGNGKEALQA